MDPLHVGVEHPNALWLAAVGLLAFVAGLGVNLYRSRCTPSETAAAVSDEESN